MIRIKSGTKEGAGYDPPALSARSLTVAVLYLQEKRSNRTATGRSPLKSRMPLTVASSFSRERASTLHPVKLV